MRSATRNKYPFYYATYTGKTPDVDSEGNYTGETSNAYSTPVQAFANISPATGMSNAEVFGNLEGYNKVIVTTETWLPIDEHTILWVDVTYGANVPHDYIVKRVAKSKNGLAIAISKVTVT